MTKEKFETAKDLVELIGYDKDVISVLDKMIEHFYDKVNYDIKVVCASGPDGYERNIRHSDFPELYDALKQARERFKYELRKKEDKLEAL